MTKPGIAYYIIEHAKQRTLARIYLALLIGAIVVIIGLFSENADLSKRNLEVVADREALRQLAIQHNLIDP